MSVLLNQDQPAVTYQVVIFIMFCIIHKLNQEGRNGVDAKSDRHKYLCHVESKRSAGLVQEQQQKSSQMYEKQHPNNKIAINRPCILFPNDLTWLSCH